MPNNKHPRKQRTFRSTEMGTGTGRRLDAKRIASPPATPDKINFRRSDWMHPKHRGHSKIVHGGSPCDCGNRSPSEIKLAVAAGRERIYGANAS
jgi:hypothetical protein